MGHFNRDNRGSGGFNRGFDSGKRFGGRDKGRPSMHRAICSECGDNCELPFKPTGDRPVFCSNCFDKQGGGNRSNKFGGDKRERRDRENRGDRNDRQMYDAVCSKCGNDCQVPFRPTASKPIFCDNCFEKGGKGGKDFGVLMEQIKMLNDKVDKLVKILVSEILVDKSEKSEDRKEVKMKEKKIKAKPAPKKVLAKRKK